VSVGRVPAGQDPDAYDRLRRRVLWSMPSGLYVIGSRAGARRNLMTANWATQVALDPKLVAVSVEHGALTRALIAEGRAFALSMPLRADRAVVRRFVKPVSDVVVDDEGNGTMQGEAVWAAANGCPVLSAAAAWLACELVEQLEVGSHTMFVGEVVDCGFGGEDPSGPAQGERLEVLRMEDTRMNYGG
jgi:flavin reductase (DIM6/NTAB) family NADH-FMN oxidoreductase RutF